MSTFTLISHLYLKPDKLFSIKTIQVWSIFDDRKQRKPVWATCSTTPLHILAILAVFQAGPSPVWANEAELTSIPPIKAADEEAAEEGEVRRVGGKQNDGLRVTEA